MLERMFFIAILSGIAAQPAYTARSSATKPDLAAIFGCDHLLTARAPNLLSPFASLNPQERQELIKIAVAEFQTLWVIPGASRWENHPVELLTIIKSLGGDIFPLLQSVREIANYIDHGLTEKQLLSQTRKIGIPNQVSRPGGGYNLKIILEALLIDQQFDGARAVLLELLKNGYLDETIDFVSTPGLISKEAQSTILIQIHNAAIERLVSSRPLPANLGLAIKSIAAVDEKAKLPKRHSILVNLAQRLASDTLPLDQLIINKKDLAPLTALVNFNDWMRADTRQGHALRALTEAMRLDKSASSTLIPVLNHYFELENSRLGLSYNEFLKLASQVSVEDSELHNYIGSEWLPKLLIRLENHRKMFRHAPEGREKLILTSLATTVAHLSNLLGRFDFVDDILEDVLDGKLFSLEISDFEGGIVEELLQLTKNPEATTKMVLNDERFNQTSRDMLRKVSLQTADDDFLPLTMQRARSIEASLRASEQIIRNARRDVGVEPVIEHTLTKDLLLIGLSKDRDHLVNLYFRLIKTRNAEGLARLSRIAAEDESLAKALGTSSTIAFFTALKMKAKW